jgi:hypothetical protein
MPEEGSGSLWRVFPWDPAAPPGTRFSPSFIPGPTGRGRFDLPRRLSGVLYTATTPDHAVGEMLHPWRGKRLRRHHLRRAGEPLASVEVSLPQDSTLKLADLCQAGFLADSRIRPNITASRYRHLTQPVARAVWDAGHHGLRWWSSFWGDWHTVVLFEARMSGRIRFGEPEILTVGHPAVETAADHLGMLTV